MSSNIHNHSLPKQNNSWYLKTGYIHHFLCKCGQLDKFGNMLKHIHHPDHSCSACGNTHFLDSVMFLTNEKVTRWSVFHWNIERIKTEEAWVVRAYESIPLFDYTLQKIRFRKVYISTMTLSFEAEQLFHEDSPIIMDKYVYNHADKSTNISDLVYKDVENELISFLFAFPVNAIAWIEEMILHRLSNHKTVDLVKFFLKHPHLKEYDFFYWDNFLIFSDVSKEYPSVEKMLGFVFNHRKEKSIRKASFKAYNLSIEAHIKYSYVADYIFSRHISDRNFLLELTNMDTKIKHVLFNEVDMYSVENMIEFLKEHYTERSITKLFTTISEYSSIIRDTIWMFRGENGNLIQEHFRKVSLNFRDLHHEFVRIHNMLNTRHSTKVTFEYQQNDLDAQTTDDMFEYRLPETTHTLNDWGRELHNCMYSYKRAIHSGNTIIFGVFAKDVLVYAVEIRGSKIVQALGKYNKRIDDNTKSEIQKWFTGTYMRSWMSPNDNKIENKG